jgi:hypothetical protein
MILTISREMKVLQEVVWVRLIDIASIQIQSGEAESSPSHHFPVNLAYESLLWDQYEGPLSIEWINLFFAICPSRRRIEARDVLVLERGTIVFAEIRVIVYGSSGGNRI